MKKDLETIYWTDVQIQAFSRSINRLMLNDVGIALTQKCLLKGQNRKAGLSQERLVIYDKLYILSYIKTKIINPLKPLGLQDLIELLTQAYNLREENNDNK